MNSLLQITLQILIGSAAMAYAAERIPLWVFLPGWTVGWLLYNHFICHLL